VGKGPYAEFNVGSENKGSGIGRELLIFALKVLSIVEGFF
jgi:hypothetical protein